MAAFLRLSFVVALAAALLACRLDSAPAPRRLVLITLDTLRLENEFLRRQQGEKDAAAAAAGVAE